MVERAKQGSPEHRAKLAEAARRWHADRRARGLPEPFSGKTHTEETKRRIGEKSKRRWQENPMVNEKHPMWKGDSAGLTSIHDWVRRRKPLQHRCEKCGKETRWTDLANIDHQYRRVVEDYIELCRSCHRLMDNARRGHPLKFKLRTHCPKGHEKTEENTYIRPSDQARCCRICRLEGKRRRRSQGRKD